MTDVFEILKDNNVTMCVNPTASVRKIIHKFSLKIDLDIIEPLFNMNISHDITNFVINKNCLETCEFEKYLTSYIKLIDMIKCVRLFFGIRIFIENTNFEIEVNDNCGQKRRTISLQTDVLSKYLEDQYYDYIDAINKTINDIKTSGFMNDKFIEIAKDVDDIISLNYNINKIRDYVMTLE